MTDGDRILQAIIDKPADDAIRLVYADWLEEQGQELRAEFIRVQLELAKWAAFLCGCTGNEDKGHVLCPVDGWGLRRRETAIRDTWIEWPGGGTVRAGFAWAHPLPAAYSWEYRRGFVARVSMPLGDWDRKKPDSPWTEYGPALCAFHPVERVVLTDCTPSERDGGWEWSRELVEGDGVYGFMHMDGNGWLPYSLFNLLPGGELLTVGEFIEVAGSVAIGPGRHEASPRTLRYPSREEAMESLSKAAIAWARAEAEMVSREAA